MHVDVIFDASFCPKHKIGSYSFFIVAGSSFRYSSSGMLKQVSTPDEAELMCMANAIHSLKKSSLFGKVTFITIHSDCMNIFGKVTNKAKNDIAKMVMKNINELRMASPLDNKRKMFFKLLHVKAHTGATDPISRANEYCHNQAKIQLQLKRDEINEESSFLSQQDETRGEAPGDLFVDSGKRLDDAKKLQVPLRNKNKKRNNAYQEL